MVPLRKVACSIQGLCFYTCSAAESRNSTVYVSFIRSWVVVVFKTNPLVNWEIVFQHFPSEGLQENAEYVGVMVVRTQLIRVAALRC